MLSNNIAGLLAPYKSLVNKAALSPTYRSLQFSPGKVVGCSASAILETNCDHGITETICVDASSFLAIVDSLPAKAEVNLEAKEGVLHWSCGSAKGRLATLVIANMPTITRRKKPGMWQPTKAFGVALKMGAMSCGGAGMSSMGIYGLTLDNSGDTLVIHSTDNATACACYLDEKLEKAPDIMTLAPDPAELLAGLIIDGESSLEFDDTSLFYIDKHCRCLIKQVEPLKKDVMKIISNYDTDKVIAKLPAPAIAAFIKRASAIADNARRTYITLEAGDGRISLNFTEGVSSADEYYLADDLDIPAMAPIPLDASKMVKALAHCTEICLDHIERRVIVLRGANPTFRYLISGRPNEEAKPKA